MAPASQSFCPWAASLRECVCARCQLPAIQSKQCCMLCPPATAQEPLLECANGLEALGAAFATSDCPPFCSGLYGVGWAVKAAERALKHIATELGCAVVVYKTLKKTWQPATELPCHAGHSRRLPDVRGCQRSAGLGPVGQHPHQPHLVSGAAPYGAAPLHCNAYILVQSCWVAALPVGCFDRSPSNCFCMRACGMHCTLHIECLSSHAHAACDRVAHPFGSASKVLHQVLHQADSVCHLHLLYPLSDICIELFCPAHATECAATPAGAPSGNAGAVPLLAFHPACMQRALAACLASTGHTSQPIFPCRVQLELIWTGCCCCRPTLPRCKR